MYSVESLCLLKRHDESPLTQTHFSLCKLSSQANRKCNQNAKTTREKNATSYDYTDTGVPLGEGQRAPETSPPQHGRPRGKRRWFSQQAAEPSSSFPDLRSPALRLARSVWRSRPGWGAAPQSEPLRYTRWRCRPLKPHIGTHKTVRSCRSSSELHSVFQCRVFSVISKNPALKVLAPPYHLTHVDKSVNSDTDYTDIFLTESSLNKKEKGKERKRESCK